MNVLWAAALASAEKETAEVGGLKVNISGGKLFFSRQHLRVEEEVEQQVENGIHIRVQTTY